MRSARRLACLASGAGGTIERARSLWRLMGRPHVRARRLERETHRARRGPAATTTSRFELRAFEIRELDRAVGRVVHAMRRRARALPSVDGVGDAHLELQARAHAVLREPRCARPLVRAGTVPADCSGDR